MSTELALLGALLLGACLWGCPAGGSGEALDAAWEDATDPGRDGGVMGDGHELVPLDPSLPVVQIDLQELEGTAWVHVEHPRRVLEGRVEVLRVGGCAFFEPKLTGECEEPCEPPAFCSPVEDRCMTHAPALDLGPVDVDGLKIAVRSEPTWPGDGDWFYYQPTFVPEPVEGELFDEGDVLVARSLGGPHVGPFEVAVTGVADLEMITPCDIAPVAHEDMLLTWTPGTIPSVFTFHMASANHGAHFSSIECTTADTGSMVVSGELLALYLADWHPVESWRAQRTSEAWTQNDDARVLLRATSQAFCHFARP